MAFVLISLDRTTADDAKTDGAAMAEAGREDDDDDDDDNDDDDDDADDHDDA